MQLYSGKIIFFCTARAEHRLKHSTQAVVHGLSTVLKSVLKPECSVLKRKKTEQRYIRTAAPPKERTSNMKSSYFLSIAAAAPAATAAGTNTTSAPVGGLISTPGVPGLPGFTWMTLAFS